MDKNKCDMFVFNQLKGILELKYVYSTMLKALCGDRHYKLSPEEQEYCYSELIFACKEHFGEIK